VVPAPGTLTVLASLGDQSPTAVRPERAAPQKAVPKTAVTKKTATAKKGATRQTTDAKRSSR
jgi:hypothetical protein